MVKTRKYYDAWGQRTAGVRHKERGRYADGIASVGVTDSFAGRYFDKKTDKQIGLYPIATRLYASVSES